MRHGKVQIKRLAGLSSVLVVAAAEALAQGQEGRTPRRIEVSLADRKLAVLEGDNVIRIFQTAVGAKASPSPTGVYRIASNVADPTWYSKGKIVRPGKSNPVGTRWLGLSLKGYGIHGTNAPGSIGHAASHGCIRMRNREVEELSTMVAVGDPVELYAQRTPELDRIFGAVLVAGTAQASTAVTAQ